MTDTFTKKINITKFLNDGRKFKIGRKSDYISYPEFIQYFSSLKLITPHNLIIAINFTYGWMPTIFKFRNENIDEAVKILNKAKKGMTPTLDELELLKQLLNNSLVGTSKLLHFINPKIFAIWDSRVYRYLTSNKQPNNKKFTTCSTYFEYLELCRYLIKQKGFKVVSKIIADKISYDNFTMTSFRIAELIMYSGGVSPKKKNK